MSHKVNTIGFRIDIGLTILLMFFFFSVESEAAYFLNLIDKEDHGCTFMIDDGLKITLRDNALVICRPSDQREIVIDDLKHIRYDLGILVSQERLADSRPLLSINGNYLLISGLDSTGNPKGEYVIFDTSGAIISKGYTDSDMKVPLYRFQAGVYILALDGCQIFKFMVR